MRSTKKALGFSVRRRAYGRWMSLELLCFDAFLACSVVSCGLARALMFGQGSPLDVGGELRDGCLQSFFSLSMLLQRFGELLDSGNELCRSGV